MGQLISQGFGPGAECGGKKSFRKVFGNSWKHDRAFQLARGLGQGPHGGGRGREIDIFLFGVLCLDSFA